MTEGMKHCSRCGEDKLLDAFYKRLTRPNRPDNYYSSWCKECNREKQREYNRKLPERRIKARLEGAVEISIKYCKCCKQDKTIGDFWKLTTSLDGYGYICKSCHSKRQIEQRKTPAGREAMLRARRKEDKRRVKQNAAKNLYGLSTEQYNLLIQEKTCEICNQPFSAKRRPVIDHQHDTVGTVRGIPCRQCNTAMGLMNDDPRILRKAVAYLEGDRKYNIIPEKIGKLIRDVQKEQMKLSLVPELDTTSKVG